MTTAPAPPDQRLLTSTIDLPTGVRLRYTEQGAADGEAILCLHGYGDSAYSFSRVLPLIPLAFRVVALDQRGHGDSARPPGGYAIADFATDAAAAMNALGIRHATVVGHSMGSLVAQQLALDHPDRVARLVLIGSATKGVNASLLALRDEVQALPDPVPLAFVREFQLSTVHAPVPEAFIDGVVAQSRKLPAHLWRAVLDGMLAFDSTAELPALACPTLIVWGDRDALFNRADQDRLRGAIPGARLKVYPETGHCPNWEHPARLARDLLAFIAATPGRGQDPGAGRHAPPGDPRP